MHPHCDEDELALMALGEDASPECAAHVDVCEQCAGELARFQQAAEVGRASGGPAMLSSPPEQVWDGIAEQVRNEPVPLAEARKRKTRSWLGLVAAVAAGMLLGAGLVGVVTGQTSEQIVAAARLAPMPESPDRGGAARASLNKTDAGYTVTVQAANMAGPEGFYEVWLLDEQNQGLVALGTLAPGQREATFTVPDGVDLQSYNAVDISDEPLDGDPKHSGSTVMRGTFA